MTYFFFLYQICTIEIITVCFSDNYYDDRAFVSDVNGGNTLTRSLSLNKNAFN